VFARFSLANEIEIAILSRIQHRVLKVGVWFVPGLIGEKGANRRVFEDPTMTTKDNAAHQRQVFKRDAGEVRRLQGGFGKIEVLPTLHRVLGLSGESSKQNY